MPRERITSTGAPTFDVTVAWGRDTTVQVATTTNDADERLRAWVEQVPLPAGADPNTEPVGTAPGTSFRLFNGWHVDLDRAGVNRLIQVLRTARDQAFGKDA